MAKADALLIQAVADGVLYDVGFADGVASVSSPTGDVTAAQEAIDIAAAVAAAIAPLNDQISALGIAKASEDALLAQVKSSAQQIVAALS